MKILLRFCVFLLGTLIFQGCEREIDLHLPATPDSIVMEGIIEPGMHPKVLISRNRNFFDDYPTNLLALLDTFLIQDAEVSIFDGITTYPLHFTIDPSNYPYAYYTSSTLLGEVGKTYSITVIAKGQTLKGQTKIPPAVAVDSSWFTLNFFDVKEDSLGFLNVAFTDPDTFGNAYRLYAKIGVNSSFFPVTGSLANDEFINGRSVNFFSGQSDKPFASQDTFVRNQFFYALGDTIYVKFCSIGRKEFDFYNTFEASTSSNGNPFASPTLIKSNVEGGIGIWCGQSFSYDTLIAH